MSATSSPLNPDIDVWEDPLDERARQQSDVSKAAVIAVDKQFTEARHCAKHGDVDTAIAEFQNARENLEQIRDAALPDMTEDDRMRERFVNTCDQLHDDVESLITALEERQSLHPETIHRYSAFRGRNIWKIVRLGILGRPT